MDPDRLAALNLRDTVAYQAQDLVDDMVHHGGADPADVAKFRTAAGDLAQLLEADYSRQQSVRLHQLVPDHNGDPSCLCGYNPAYDGLARRTQAEAAQLVQAHIAGRRA